MGSNERTLKEEHILEYQVLLDSLRKLDTHSWFDKYIVHLQAAFNQFDHKNTGLVATKDLGNVLR